MPDCTCRMRGAIPEKHTTICPHHPKHPDFIPLVPRQPTAPWKGMWDHPRGEDYVIF